MKRHSKVKNLPSLSLSLSIYLSIYLSHSPSFSLSRSLSLSLILILSFSSLSLSLSRTHTHTYSHTLRSCLLGNPECVRFLIGRTEVTHPNKPRVARHTIPRLEVNLQTTTFVLLRTHNLGSISYNFCIHSIKFAETINMLLFIHCELFYIV